MRCEFWIREIFIWKISISDRKFRSIRSGLNFNSPSDTRCLHVLNSDTTNNLFYSYVTFHRVFLARLDVKEPNGRS